MQPDVQTKATILVIDDMPANVFLLETLLKQSGHHVVTCTDATVALDAYRTVQPDLILLDLHMPVVSGYDLLEAFRNLVPDLTELPILVFTADVNPDSALRALKLGASDFLTKPGIIPEIQVRVANFLRAHAMHQKLKSFNQELETKVQERTRALWESQTETLERLARVGEHREESSSAHASRVGEIAGGIAIALGLSRAMCEVIRLAAPLHDIGRVAIPDTILSKRGILSDVEVRAVRAHTTIGAEILSGGRSMLMREAEAIARAHHERWDGTGYPNHLKGEAIPLSARIVAVADAYEVLTSEGRNRGPVSPEEAIDRMLAQSGTSFDPQVVDALTVSLIIEREKAVA